MAVDTVQYLDRRVSVKPGMSDTFLRTREHDSEPVERLVPVRLVGNQYKFFVDTVTRYLFFCAGIGCGKTFTGSRWAINWMKHESSRDTIGLIGATTHKQLEQVTLRAVWEAFDQLGLRYGTDYVYNERPPRAWRYTSQFRSHSGILTVKHWGQCICASMTNYNALRGIEIGWFWLDEAPYMVQEAWDMLLGRHRCKKASRLLGRLSGTPTGFNWTYAFFEEQPTDNPELRDHRKIVRMSTFQNPHLPKEYLKNLLAAYSPAQARQELAGHFVNVAAGAVYTSFDRMRHVKDGLKVSQHHPLVLSWDFNRTPFCAVVLQHDGTNVLVIDEIRMENATTYDMCSAFIQRYGHHKQPIHIYGDAMGRHQLTTTSNWSDYEIIEQQLGNHFGSKNVELLMNYDNGPVVDRVNAVNALLLNLKRESRMFIDKRCRYLIRDLEQVVWAQTGRNQIDKSKQYKDFTHMSDALGYFAVVEFPVKVERVGVVNI